MPHKFPNRQPYILRFYFWCQRHLQAMAEKANNQEREDRFAFYEAQARLKDPS